MVTLEYAKNPIYGTPDGECINLIVKWQEFNEEHPFSATSYDPMPHGVALFNRAKAGEFGEVGAYVPDPSVAHNQPISSGSQIL